MEIEFRDPPRRRGAPVRVESALAGVRRRPGEWACIARLGSARSCSSFVARLRRGPDAAGFEFTSRALADGCGEVFAIFTGETES